MAPEAASTPQEAESAPPIVLQRTWDDADNSTLKAFRRFINASNAGQVDRDIAFVKSTRQHEVRVYDKYLVSIINQFEFADENAAKEAVRLAEALS